jgi:hypothetical protein
MYNWAKNKKGKDVSKVTGEESYETLLSNLGLTEDAFFAEQYPPNLGQDPLLTLRILVCILKNTLYLIR